MGAPLSSTPLIDMKNELMQRSSWLDARELVSRLPFFSLCGPWFLCSLQMGNEVLGAHGTYACADMLFGEEITVRRVDVCVLKMNNLPDIFNND